MRYAHRSSSLKIHNDCIPCIENQALRVCELLRVTHAQREAILSLTKRHIESFHFGLTPPHNATPLYEAMAEYLGMDDLYADIKQASSQKARSYQSLCAEKIINSHHRLLTATKTAVAGNVIDLASVMMYDLEEELAKIYHMPFAIDDFSFLESTLAHTKTLVYLADNAGEEIFDKLYIQTIQALYPTIDIYYFVRGRPIINDLTCKDAYASGMHDVATIVDSGVPTPGLAMEFMSDTARNLFEKAECIISKGMGNYECLGDVKNLPIFFLLKIKCHVVANDIGAKLGDIVCKKGM